jgi:hypothetical protein
MESKTQRRTKKKTSAGLTVFILVFSESKNLFQNFEKCQIGKIVVFPDLYSNAWMEYINDIDTHTFDKKLFSRPISLYLLPVLEKCPFKNPTIQ